MYGQGCGRIAGIVRDPLGAAVPRARVTAAETGTTFSRFVETSAEGYYLIPSLRPSNYVLAVVVPGFHELRQ